MNKTSFVLALVLTFVVGTGIVNPASAQQPAASPSLLLGQQKMIDEQKAEIAKLKQLASSGKCAEIAASAGGDPCATAKAELTARITEFEKNARDAAKSSSAASAAKAKRLADELAKLREELVKIQLEQAREAGTTIRSSHRAAVEISSMELDKPLPPQPSDTAPSTGASAGPHGAGFTPAPTSTSTAPVSHGCPEGYHQGVRTHASSLGNNEATPSSTAFYDAGCVKNEQPWMPAPVQQTEDGHDHSTASSTPSGTPNTGMSTGAKWGYAVLGIAGVAGIAAGATVAGIALSRRDRIDIPTTGTDRSGLMAEMSSIGGGASAGNAFAF